MPATGVDQEPERTAAMGSVEVPPLWMRFRYRWCTHWNIRSQVLPPRYRAWVERDLASPVWALRQWAVGMAGLYGLLLLAGLPGFLIGSGRVSDLTASFPWFPAVIFLWTYHAHGEQKRDRALRIQLGEQKPPQALPGRWGALFWVGVGGAVAALVLAGIYGLWL